MLHARLLFAFCVALTLVAPTLHAADRLPNIVLIVSDDQGYHDLGSFGNKEIITPNLDRVAKEGVRCTNYYVSWPACTPSRGSILTGRYPQRNGLYDMIRNDVADFGRTFTEAEYSVTPERILGMDTREIMFPEVLKQAGYATAVFGKWDGGQLKRYLPLQRGFDEYFGHVNTGIDYFTHERYSYPSMYRDNYMTTEDKGTYCTDLFRREALRFVRNQQDKPFFLYLPFNAPHGASNLDPKIRGAAQAPEKFKAMYPKYQADEGYQKGTRYGKEAMVPNRAKRKLEYLGAVTCMDAAIGDVLNLLDELKLADNTLVIFFSDNGGSGGADNTPLSGHKGQMREGGIRVPFVARFPGRIPAGTVSHEFLTSLELFPTFTKLVGQKLPAGVIYDGHDMLPVLTGKQKSQRTEMFWQRRADKAARIGHYKWVDAKTGSGVYDLKNDIGEKHVLSKERPELAARLKARFEAWRKAMDETEPRGPFRDF